MTEDIVAEKPVAPETAAPAPVAPAPAGPAPAVPAPVAPAPAGPIPAPAGPTPAASTPTKTLVIAEKRSVGRTLAAFLGCRADRGAWIEGERFDVTWAQGHLLRLLMPDEYGEFPAWRTHDVATLPLIPPADGWRWQVSAERGANAQFDALAGLVTSGRYGRIVNACDPDREGQCIADLALQFIGCALPVDRLWCSSLEDAALEKAFKRMKPNAEYRGLFESAVARSKADWLVGMNASRLYSAAMHSAQSVGRVRTPTLALVVERDRAIEAFKASETFRVRLDLGDGFFVTGEPIGGPASGATPVPPVPAAGSSPAASGAPAAAAAPAGATPAGPSALPVPATPAAAKALAEKILAEAQGAPCQITEVERKRCREGAPTLLNTTGAQKLASELLGMAPDAVDRALQALYEKKLATYPRTDSKFVNAEDGAGLEALVVAVADEAHVGAGAARAFAAMPHDVSKVVDDAKVEGHGALLPTRQLTAAKLAALPEEEAAVARLLCESLLAAVAPDRVYDRVAVKAVCRGLPYTASSTADVDRGWKKLRGSAASGGGSGAGAAGGLAAGASGTDGDADTGADDAKTRIPADLQAGDVRTVVGGEVKKTTAKPPRRYTDATLLAAMEHADRLMEEDELKAAIKDSSLHSGGIGTPATRAGIIASLVDRGYLARKGSTLTSTVDGRNLVDEVAPELKSVELTARMERDLSVIARENADPMPFMAGVVDLVCRIVEAQRSRPFRTAAPRGASIGKCPVCGGQLVDTGNERSPYVCENTRRERVDAPDGTAAWRDCGTCSFRLHRSFMGAAISPAAAKKLAAGKSVMLKGLTCKDGTTIDRMVELDPAQGWRPHFAADQSFKMGVCPKCGGRVLDVGNERAPYLCEHNTTRRGPARQSAGAGEQVATTGAPDAPRSACDFKLYREYLGKRLSKTDVAALLGGKTVTLKGLTSQKTGEKFDAFVVLDPERDFRLRITGYPAEQPAKKQAKPAAKPSRPDNQATLPGFEW